MDVLVVDSSYIAWRAFHSIRELSHEDVPTGVTYGFFRELVTLQDRFATRATAFAFDSKQSLRTKLCPTYKENRKKKEYTKEEMKRYMAMQEQLKSLRLEYLPSVGYSNVLFQRGYEADDLIASFCMNEQKRSKFDRIIIVSADKDLYQLLSKKVRMYNPHKKELMGPSAFTKKYKIEPTLWPWVKALAGCPTDNVIGMRGVGEKTAISRLTNARIWKKGDFDKQDATIKQNLPLVKLPFKGTNDFAYKPDNINPKKFQKLFNSLGFKLSTFASLYE